MIHHKTLVHSSFTLALVALVWNVPLLQAQEYSTLTNVTNPCITMTVKAFDPTMTNPSMGIVIVKILDMIRPCGTLTMNSAFCNPGAVVNTASLVASVFGTQLTMMPSCEWTCSSCPNVITNSGVDGLPVELMDFEIAVSKSASELGEVLHY